MLKIKRSQIRMGETIAVLIIFFFLLIIGAIFFFNVKKNSLYSDLEDYYSKQSIEISQVVSYLPELQKKKKKIIEANCYNIYKLEAAKNHTVDNSNFYFPFFSYSEIVIQEVYPETQKWVLYNYTINNSAPILTYIPISLYDPTDKAYSFGVLSIAYYPFYN
jgi:hypothetical protein